MKPYYDDWDEAFDRLGAPEAKDMQYFKRYYGAHDSVLQLCSPSLDCYTSDLPSNIEFAGVLPPRQALSGFQHPKWWADVQSSEEAGKKVVLVSQGSLATDPTHFIIPDMKGLAEAESTLVIVTLGSKDAKLPDGVVVPSNTRVIDYIYPL
jgi:UDP:flavonoid glycosyltransferase YjiC (YdhE family)